MIPVRLFLLFCAKLEAIYDWVCPCQVGEPDLVFSRSQHLKLEVRCGENNYPDSARLFPQCTDDSGQFNNCRIRDSSVHPILVLVTKNLDGDVSETKRSTRDPQVANDQNFGAVSDYLLWSHVPKGAKDEVGLRRGPLTSSSQWKFIWHQPASWNYGAATKMLRREHFWRECSETRHAVSGFPGRMIPAGVKLVAIVT